MNDGGGQMDRGGQMDTIPMAAMSTKDSENYEAWHEDTMMQVRGERHAYLTRVVIDAMEPLRAHQIALQGRLRDLYAEAHQLERDLVIVVDRLNFAITTERNGSIPFADVDPRVYLSYGEGNETPMMGAQPTKDRDNERHDDRSGVRGQRAGAVGGARAVPRKRTGR